MSNMKDKSAETKQRMDNLQDELDFAVFEQEEMDPGKVKEILAKMESIDPEADTIKAHFDKDLAWEKIQERCRVEMAEEFAAGSTAVGSGVAGGKVIAGTAGAGKRNSGKSKSAKGNSGKIRRIALSAATIVIAVFVGANIGTYATEKKNVIEYVQELQNGTSFWVTGDAPSMEVKKEKEVYYSWNDVPNEYKEFLIIPQGLPEDMGLYDIKIALRDTVDEIVIRYIDAEAKNDFVIQITANQNEEFTFANLMYENEYKFLEEKKVGTIDLYFYSFEDNEEIVQFVYDEYIYTLSGTLKREEMQIIIEKTIESNF